VKLQENKQIKRLKLATYLQIVFFNM